VALSNAEMVKMWRQRQNSIKHERYKQKEKDIQKQKRTLGDGKREARLQRRNWRKNQRAKRQRDKMILNQVRELQTPPMSPDSTEIQPQPEPEVIEDTSRRKETMKRKGRKKK